MSRTSSIPRSPAQPAAVDAVTRSAVTIIIAITALISFVFSFGNVTLLCLSFGVPHAIAWLVSPAVDLSVTGLLLATNALVQRRPANGDNSRIKLWKARLMLCACGLLTLALNTAGPATHGRLGAALVSAVLPVLLLGWSEVGPSLLHQLYAVPQAAPGTGQASGGTEDNKANVNHNAVTLLRLSPDQVDTARSLDAEHRQANQGRPISRDRLRSGLNCSTDRASAIIKIIRADANANTGTAHSMVQQDGPHGLASAA